MNKPASNREHPTLADEEAFRIAAALVVLGEGKAAIDMMRVQVNRARRSLPATSRDLFRVLSEYAGILESTDALAEAEFIRTEALEIVAAAQWATEDAIEAFLRHGMLLCRMHDYDGAIAKLKEAIRLTEEVSGVEALRKEMFLAEAWRSRAQALEALGEFSQASQALDTLMTVKRHIRFLVFSMVS